VGFKKLMKVEEVEKLKWVEGISKNGTNSIKNTWIMLS
jgi:ERCC4-type nuclease